MAADPVSAVSGLDRAGPEFRCEIRPARERAYIQPVGELDMATAPRVDEAFGQLQGDGFEELVLDLRSVCFMDSTGLNLILRWAGVCRLSIVPGPPKVARVFTVTRTDELLRVVDQPEVEPARVT